MVFYFTAIANDGDNWMIYMGKDKYENEELIKYGWPEDLWFHVDNYSSAHVYLRLPNGHTMDTIPPEILEDCCQLVKANSIEGNKVNNITIVYTPWGNLKKTGAMDVGQVGFRDNSQVRKYKIDKRKNEIVNKLNKTKMEDHPDLAAQRDERDRNERNSKKEQLRDVRHKEKEEMDRKTREKEARSYDRLMDEERMVSNKDLADSGRSVQEIEEDFM